jgi:two-component system, OmpR family, response regulator
MSVVPGIEARPAVPRPSRDPDRPKILLVEDDREVSRMLVDLLHEAGYAVEVAHEGRQGLRLAAAGTQDVLVVDRGIPAVEGSELIRRLRAWGITTPALLLTAWGTVDDLVEGLDAGAEDYLVKPFQVQELLARIRALRRRHRPHAELLPLGDRSLAVSERRVFGPGRDDVQLSGRECTLLELLARHPDRTFGRRDLLRDVFDSADSSSAVDTYVHYLRRKLGREVVRTVHGRGYRMGRA